MKGFYKVSNKVLKFDVNKEIDEIRFNHYLMQKENGQRLNSKEPLERGCLRLAKRTVATDLKISDSKAQRLIDKFIDLGIIEQIEKSTKRGVASVYGYTTEYKSEPNCEPNYEPNKHSDFNGLSNVGEPNCEPNCEPSKKELEKEFKKVSMYVENKNTLLVDNLNLTTYSDNMKSKVSKWNTDRLTKAIDIFKRNDGVKFALLEKIYYDDNNFKDNNKTSYNGNNKVIPISKKRVQYERNLSNQYSNNDLEKMIFERQNNKHKKNISDGTSDILQ